MSYKKHGGLHFVRIGRFGFSFFWSAKARTPRSNLDPRYSYLAR